MSSQQNTRQFIRLSRLAVGAADGGSYLDLSDLQFKFFVARGDTQTPNSCHARVYNVSRQTASMLQAAPNSEFASLSLIAGYDGNAGLIFSGNIRYINSGHENATDSYLDIVAADGDSAYNFAVVNTTLAAGSTPADQIAVCQTAMMQVKPATDAGYVSPLNGTALPRGKVMYGMVRDHMRVIANTAGASWSIQDGGLQVVPEAGNLPGNASVVNSGTGMIGFPQRTINGIQVRTLLNPSIRINSIIQLNNRDIQGFDFDLTYASNLPSVQLQTNQQLRLNGNADSDGFYQVLWTEHVGDTRGNEWYSDIICVATDVDENFKINAAKFVVPPDTLVTLTNG